jgi:hypothetical protein
MTSTRARFGLGLAVVLALALQARLWSWNVEDAAISFGYAKHIAQGWGPVPYPGGEPSEGFSNPAWVMLLVPFLWLGFDAFDVAPALGMVLTVAAVVFVFQAAKARLGEVGGLVAALAMATHAQVAIWAQSGLENSLFVAAAAAGLWRLDADRERPWAAGVFLVLAFTRPEAPAWALLAMAASIALAVPVGGALVRRRAGQWLVGFVAPFLVLHLLRFGVFGAEMPATYYAKIKLIPFDLWDWRGEGWAYLGRYHAQLGQAASLPLLVLGASGVVGWRGLLGGFAAVAAGLGMAGASTAPELGVVGVVGGLAVGVGLAASRSPWWGAVAAFGALQLAFVIRTGDWMTGFRWMSLTAVPASMLFAAAAVEGWRWASSVGGRTAAWLWAVPLAVAWAPTQVHFAWRYADRPETSPQSIQRRVNHYHQLADRLLERRRLLVVDQDMGANLYWGSDRFDVRDARGLTDLTFALHQGAPAAVDSTLRDSPFERPAFVHLHNATLRALGGRPWFRREYVEVPGYPKGSSEFHTGQYVRRDLFLGGWDGPARPHQLDGLDVLGWRARAPEVSGGSGFLFEVAVRAAGLSDDAQLLLVASSTDGASLHSWNLPLGYGWVPPSDWRDDEVFVGKYPVPVPEDMPLGWYELALVLIEPSGVRTNLGGVARSAPALSPHEAKLGRGLHVVPPETMRDLAAKDLALAKESASKRNCTRAEEHYTDAWAHRIRSADWLAARELEMRPVLARCWGDRASRRADRLRTGSPEPEEGFEGIEDALIGAAREVRAGRRWDPGEERVLRGARRVGALCEARGQTMLAQGDLAGALYWLDLAARTDPRQVLARRRAEQVRAELLGLPNRL